MTTEEVKKAIESKINEIDSLKKELTEMIFANPQVIEYNEHGIGSGYIGRFKVFTENKKLEFAVHKNGWLTSYDNYLVGVEVIPCIKDFVILNEKKCLKREINELEKLIAELGKSAE